MSNIPGFRSNAWWKKIIASFGYGFMGLIFLTIILVWASTGNENTVESPTETTATNRSSNVDETEQSEPDPCPGCPESSGDEPYDPYPDKPDLELVEHSDVAEQYSRYIVGTVKNNTSREYGYVQVEINLYDDEGTQVGSTLDNTNNLEPGGTWKFKAVIIEDEATRYKIMEVSGF